ncbi:hypothetical protein J2S74_003184 [Evansella vedderi]|uniref:DUF3891 family protein n=1 Tax=Evansella vedderi TaxID=38282 RepID=A0ABT9ZX46_9BACI|nr:DUF3891 family protein [Evansella vedderi]MDQ0255802.1 hypothetical protein [Evansella vedderi]
MIVREQNGEYMLIEQHDHALISGILAKEWNEELFIGEGRRCSVELAIEQHDACWKELDKNIVFVAGEPASFTDYPLKDKIAAYRRGIEEMILVNPYAALLISLHYSSFFRGKLDEAGVIFKQEELDRQNHLYKFLSVKEEEVHFQFDLLQLCDNLSLYLCMNEWGSSKEKEYPWFKNGFPQQLAPVGNNNFYTKWIGEDKVGITPYPFKGPNVEVTIPYKTIEKGNVSEKDFQNKYNRENKQYHSIAFVPME